MKTKITQKEIVKNVLYRRGRIGRNFCLKNRISRLGAIIVKLKKEGWEFETRYFDVKTSLGVGKDYEYKATYIPNYRETYE